MANVYDYRISNGSTAAAGAGTVSVSIGFNNLTGVGTSFTTQAHVGDIIRDGLSNVVGVVALITDNTHLSLNLNSLILMSGAGYSIDPMVNVETLTPVFPFAPKGVPKLWYQGFDLGDGTKRGLGAPSTKWHFGFVTQGFRDALRVYCPAGTASANVWIRSMGLDNTNAFLTYSAAMLWPDEEPLDARRRVPFEVEFRALVIL